MVKRVGNKGFGGGRPPGAKEQIKRRPRSPEGLSILGNPQARIRERDKLVARIAGGDAEAQRTLDALYAQFPDVPRVSGKITGVRGVKPPARCACGWSRALQTSQMPLRPGIRARCTNPECLASTAWYDTDEDALAAWGRLCPSR